MNILNNINHIITEARSHSDINKKLTLFEQLYHYRNSDCYVTFNKIDKVGLNPKSVYNRFTMVGVYAYPLDFILYHLRNFYYSHTNIGIDDVKHSHDNKYLYDKIFADALANVNVLKRVDVAGKEFVFESEYNNFERDSKIIQEYIESDIMSKVNKYKEPSLYKNLLLRKGSIIAIMLQHRDFKGILLAVSKISGTLIDYFYKDVNKFGTKRFGIFLTNFLINKLNYSGISDNQFKGATLHYDIPYETIFLHPQSYQVLASFNNKNYVELINNDLEWRKRLIDMFSNLDVSYYEKYDNRFKNKKETEQ